MHVSPRQHPTLHLRLTAMLAAGLALGLAGGFACGDGLTDGRCVTNADCHGGETCEPVSGTCSCDTTAVPDACTAADPKTVCRAATKRCEPVCSKDADCTAGETCDTANGVCKCTPGATPDTCTQADANAVCHLDTNRCVTTCADDSACTGTDKCDPAAHVCRDPSKFQAADCTAAGATCNPGTHCNTTSKACEADCDATSCGAGTHCNTTSKACEADCTATSCGAGTHCGAAKACVTDCTAEICAAAGQVCNDTTHECEEATSQACDSTEAQPSACNQGDLCANNDKCEAIPAPTCANFDAHANLGTTGPIIYSVVAGSRAADAGFCSGSTPERVKAHVQAYDKNGTFPTDKANLQVHYVKENGSEGSVAITGYTRSNGDHNAEFDLNFCVATGTVFTIGIHFVGGNGICKALTP